MGSLFKFNEQGFRGYDLQNTTVSGSRGKWKAVLQS
jgi:hypothetical protein